MTGANEIVKGGQGRSSRSLIKDAAIILAMIVAFGLFALLMAS